PPHQHDDSPRLQELGCEHRRLQTAVGLEATLIEDYPGRRAGPETKAAHDPVAGKDRSVLWHVPDNHRRRAAVPPPQLARDDPRYSDDSSAAQHHHPQDDY